ASPSPDREDVGGAAGRSRPKLLTFTRLKSSVGSGQSEAPSRPTMALIDLSAIAANYRHLRGRAGEASVFPVVKANAYGHGAVRVARRLEAEGADRLAVAIAEEGVELRRAGIRSEILLLNFSDPWSAPLVASYGLIPTLYDLAQIRGYAEARSWAQPLPVHLKIDTGLGG